VISEFQTREDDLVKLLQNDFITSEEFDNEIEKILYLLDDEEKQTPVRSKHTGVLSIS